MAREDLLAALMVQLTQKESPPPPDDNALIQKMIAPNETTTMSDVGVSFTVSNPTTFVWGGYQQSVSMMGVINDVYISPGWKWNQGQYK